VLWAFTFLPSPFFAFMRRRAFTAFHHIGETKTSPPPSLILSGRSYAGRHRRTLDGGAYQPEDRLRT
jgi:hypothetical protein